MSARAARSPANLNGEPRPPIAVGDLVRTGENSYPQYQVIATSEDQAWVRDVQRGTDHVVPIGRCRKIELAWR